MAKEPSARKLVAQNRRAFHEYAIEERFEAGIVLTGSEVKSLREGRAKIGEAHAGEMDGELFCSTPISPNMEEPTVSTMRCDGRASS